MKLVVVAVGKLRGPELRVVANDYFSRLKKYVPCEEREVKTADELEGKIPEGAFVVALEVNGEALSSPELAQRVEQWGRLGKGIVAFLIGAADGIPGPLSARADVRISLSRMTLPHRLARILLAEQLYRAMTILRGEPYARE
ncbi:MAG TPA: 23S rRNA (pseudouridine(1915)-N(3))-methyltransferase RlmH [Polyangiaceae bacterium]